MTYFLDQEGQAPTIPARGIDKPPATWADGVAAFFDKSQLENDANFRLHSETLKAGRSRVDQVFKSLDQEEVLTRLHKEGILPPRVQSVPPNLLSDNSRAQSVVLDMAREQQAGGKFSGIDLSQDGIDKEVNDSLQREYRDAEATIAVMPGGQGSAGFIGSMAGMMADVKNLPFLFLGGGEGPVLRVMAREAAINAGAELAFMPSRFKMAKRLGIEDPHVVSDLAKAAIGGAIFGGAVEGGRRALGYFSGRSALKPLPGFDIHSSNAIIQAVEDAIARDADPAHAAQSMASALPAEPPPSRPPLIPDEATAIDAPATGPNIAQDGEVAPAQPMTREDQAHALEDAFAKDFPEMRHKYPLGRIIQRLGGIQAKRLNRATGEMEMTHAAQELAHMGVTQRTHPFMFRKNGHGELDNIPASEHPGLMETLGGDHSSGYLDREALLNALGAELSGRGKHPLSGEIAARMNEIEALRSGRPDTTPIQDFLSGAKSDVPGSLYFSQDELAFMSHEDVAAAFHTWSDQMGYSDILTPREKNELIYTLHYHGGDAQNLIETMWQREINFAKAQRRSEHAAPIEGHEPAAQGDVGGGNQTGERPVSDGSGPRGGEARPANDGSPAFERTAAGEQGLIHGVDPISQRQRLEVAQGKPLRGGNAPADHGLFDTGARSQLDMFSDTASKEARVVQDAVIADFRDVIEKDGDFAVDLGDGKGERPASDALADLDEGDKFAARISLCGMGPK